MKKILVLALAAALAGCISTAPRQQLQGPVYEVRGGSNIANTQYAQVLAWKYVQLKSPVVTTWQGTAASGAAGAAIGGAIGNSIGKGNGKKLATTLGVIGGAASGVAIRDAYAEQQSLVQGYELQVQLNDPTHRILTISQPVYSDRFAVGMTVTLVEQQVRGTYRASPL